ARCSGVAPASSATDGRAPARISRSAIARSSRCAAQCSAVAPSPAAAFTSIAAGRAFSSARTDSASLFLTASIRRKSPGAAMARAVSAATTPANTTLQRQHARIEASAAVANLVEMHVELVEERQVQVGQRHVLEADVPAALQMAGAAAGQDQR